MEKTQPTKMNYQQQNTELIKNFLNRTFFKSWKTENPDLSTNINQLFYGNYNSLEMSLGSACSAKCKYCYIDKFKNYYFPTPELKNPITIYENAKILFDWLLENKMKPKLELFGGDILSHDLGYEVLRLALDYSAKGTPICKYISIPTNMYFLLDEKKTKLVTNLINISREVKTPITLSASVDGFYMEENRPLASGEKLTNDFYDKLFKYSKTVGFGFHPMIYSNHIDKWIDNFNWFQENFEKYNIRANNIYLLEVRNVEWNEKQCMDLYKFMKYLAKYSYNKIKDAKDPIHEFFRNYWHFNILSSPFIEIGRGLGCSLQSCVYLRMADLTTFPCHRLFYDDFKLFSFIKENNKIIDIEGRDPELYVATNSLNRESLPFCEQCVLSGICSHGCLGSQFEVTGDLFVPIPSMCRMEFYKIRGILDGFNESGFLNKILSTININRKKKILNFLRRNNEPK